MDKMPRRSVHEQFEEMYLRSREAERYLKHADQSVLDDPDFRRAIRYVRNKFVRSEGFYPLFLRNGFDEEDLLSVATFIGLTFTGRQKALGLDPKNFYLMIRFVCQRIGQMGQFVVRKFDVNEVTAVNFIEDMEIFPDQSAEQVDDGDEDPYQEPKKQRLETRNRLRARLGSDPVRYKDDLCYYATAKCVGSDVRKAARAACSKYGFDFKAWLIDQVKAGKLNSYDHCY